MMNRQIRVEKKKILVQLNVSLLVAQSKFNPYKRYVCRSKAIRHAAPAVICSWLSLTG